MTNPRSNVKNSATGLQSAAISGLAAWQARHSAVLASDLSGPLPEHPGFPFVGPAQKAEIERRERMKADQLQKVREVREDRPAPLPAKPKKLKQETLC